MKNRHGIDIAQIEVEDRVCVRHVRDNFHSLEGDWGTVIYAEYDEGYPKDGTFWVRMDDPTLKRAKYHPAPNTEEECFMADADDIIEHSGSLDADVQLALAAVQLQIDHLNSVLTKFIQDMTGERP